jgi:DNA replication protein DnaC
VSARLNELTSVGVPGKEESTQRGWGGNAPAAADPPTCPSCFGTGMEVVVEKGRHRCHCRTREAQAKHIEAARIPRRYSECTLSDYRQVDNNGSHLRAFNYAYQLVHDYPAVDRGLLLIGPCGVGKLHPSNYPCRTESCATRNHQGH